MKLAVTGAGGLLGSALLKKARGHDVFSLYNQHKPTEGIPVHVDLRDRVLLAEALREIKPDAIVHAAAMTDVDGCEREQGLASAINFEATKTIAECAKEIGAFLVYVSTDYVFDGEKGMHNENDETRPINWYGRTKLMGEQAIRKLLPEYLIARASVIYGSTPSSGKTNFALWVLQSLRAGKPINVTRDQFVSPTLNTNLAGMLLECLEKRPTGVIHLAGATRVSRLEFALALCREWSLDPSSINPVEMDKMSWNAPRPRDSSLDVTKAVGSLRTGPATLGESLHSLRVEVDAMSPVRAK